MTLNVIKTQHYDTQHKIHSAQGQEYDTLCNDAQLNDTPQRRSA